MAHAARRKEIPPKTLQLISVIRAAVVLAMAVLMFLFSFFGLAKIYGVPIRETQFNLSSYTNKAEEVTAFDLLEGAAAWNNPMTEEELREDLSRFIEETRGADAADRFFSQNGSLSEKAEIVKEYNLFKATASDRNAYYNSSFCAELILFSVSSLLCILASAGFAAAATVRLIFLLKGKKDLKAPLWLNFLALGCMLFTLFGMSSFFGASWAGAAAPAIALIVAGIFALAAEITWSFLSEKHPVSRVRVGAIVASSIGVLLIAAAGASAIRMGYFLPYSNDAGYGLGGLVRAFDMLRRAMDDPDLLGSLKSLLDEAIHGSLLDPSEIYFLLDPANMGVYGYYSVEQGFAVLGVITGTAFLLTLISALVSGADALSALVRGRRQKLAPAIVTAILGCTLLGLSIGFTALTNQITQSDVVYYGTSVSASTVLAALLSVANLVQCIVFRLSGKKKKKTETKQTAPSVR